MIITRPAAQPVLHIVHTFIDPSFHFAWCQIVLLSHLGNRCSALQNIE